MSGESDHAGETSAARSSRGVGGALAFIRDIARTPLSQLVRGQVVRGKVVHGRVGRAPSPQRIIAESGLPEPVRARIERIVRLTRLWRSEQCDVTQELVAHFQDSLEADRSADEVLHTFGDAVQAAKLIRRAKKRNRPAWWRASRRMVQTVSVTLVAVVALYLALAVRYYLGEPTIRVDYFALISEPARTVPEGDRAWPLYRDAHMAVRDDDRIRAAAGSIPGDEGWETLRSALRDYAAEFAMIRRAAAKPSIGYVVAPTYHREDYAYMGIEPLHEFDTDDDVGLFGALLPYLGAMNAGSRLLQSDAHLAMEEGDGDRVRENILAIMRASGQLRDTWTTIDQLVRFAILHLATDLIGTVLAEHSQLLSDNDLRTLAHELAAASGGIEPLRMDFRGERAAFEDLMQQAFTDDGRGGGRVTSSGLSHLANMLTATGGGRGPGLGVSGDYLPVELARETTPTIVRNAIGPGLGLLVADRRELMRMYDRVMAQLEREAATPLWMKDRKSLRMVEELVGDSTLRHSRYLPVVQMLPPLWHTTISAERATQRRDAVQTAIALEVYRRRHGEWPASLDELVPSLLPAMPLDRFDGRPLRYVVRDGEAILYSVGANRTDMGGMEPRPIAGPFHTHRPLNSVSEETLARMTEEHHLALGDWILWRSKQ